MWRVPQVDAPAQAQRRRAAVEALEPQLGQRQAQLGSLPVDAAAGLDAAGWRIGAALQIEQRLLDPPGAPASACTHRGGAKRQAALIPAARCGIGRLQSNEQGLRRIELNHQIAAELGGGGRHDAEGGEQPLQVERRKRGVQARQGQGLEGREPRGRLGALRVHAQRQRGVELGKRARKREVERHIAGPGQRQRRIGERVGS